MPVVVGNVYLLKMAPKLLRDDLRTYVRIKNVIWYQLLATKSEVIQSYAVFLLYVHNTGGDCFCSLSKGILKALKRYCICRQPWNTLTVINKIVFTSPKAMLEFFQEKN